MGIAASRLRAIALAARRVAAHPTWAGAYARWSFQRLRSPDRPLAAHDAEAYLTDEDTALRETLDVSADRLAALREPFERMEHDDTEPGALNDGSIELQGAISASVRALEPDVVVETGVARGFSSATALRALEDLGHGHLHSIELPTIDPADTPDADIGLMVPSDLRGRWSLHLGPARRLLPKLLAELGAVDVFVHDSDHRYANQVFEITTVWPRLQPGGVIIVDDIDSPALIEAAQRYGVRPFLVERWPPGKSPLGIMRKPERARRN